MAADKTRAITRHGQRVPMARSTTVTRPRPCNDSVWTRRLRARSAYIAREQSLWPTRSPLRCILRLAMSRRRPPRAASRARHSMTPGHLLHRRQSLRQLFFNRSRPARLSNGQRARKTWKHGHGNAGKHQARQHGDGQDILLYSLARDGIRSAEDYALDFVVYAPAGLECIRSGLEGEVV